jgi:hypothetical protein
MNAISKPPTRSKLKAVPPKSVPAPKSKIVVFGKSGVGKTVGALGWPRPFFIDTENGASRPEYTALLEKSGGVYLGPAQGSLSFDTIIEQVKALATETHDYKTLIIDSITKAFLAEVARTAETLAEENKKNEYGADRKPAIAYMRQLISWLMRVDMNVILIAHQKDEYGLNNKKEKVVIGEIFDCWDRLEYELDLCLHVKKAGNSRIASVRKTRLASFPDGSSFPWSYNDFADRYGKEVIEQSQLPIKLATLEQIAEVKRLLTFVRMSDGWESKMFAAAEVSSWEDMDEEKIALTISMLKNRLDPNQCV